ncbi:MAG: SDR family oxidoreductase [Clostridia bacterium]
MGAKILNDADSINAFLVPAAFSPEVVASWGTRTPMGRAAQPYEIAPGFVFLASDDSSYMTGQTLQIFA